MVLCGLAFVVFAIAKTFNESSSSTDSANADSSSQTTNDPTTNSPDTTQNQSNSQETVDSPEIKERKKNFDLWNAAEQGNKVAWQLLVFAAKDESSAKFDMYLTLLSEKAPIEMPQFEQRQLGIQYFASQAKNGDIDSAQTMVSCFAMSLCTEGLPNYGNALYFQLLANKLTEKAGQGVDSHLKTDAEEFAKQLTPETVKSITEAVDANMQRLEGNTKEASQSEAQDSPSSPQSQDAPKTSDKIAQPAVPGQQSIPEGQQPSAPIERRPPSSTQ